MGIRTLHRRTPEATPRARADSFSAQAVPASPVPAFAAGASTARIPADLAATVRRVTKELRRGLAGRPARTPDWRQWADLARGYLALTVTLIPRSRPRHTLTVFVASLTERPSAPGRRRPPRRDRRDRRPDARP
ncbi:hypothetical protein JK359_23180 [Streptomyces actinomycinicus]|uniref:Uncharacterized protein n=1 Tax=Streptomyces actinomycinicus TaxID=1695166 RepID=A0A937JQQ5_9ACTN|nr:hypothetical protein [Streptomyces actinomycinicus]MBL1084837.1 hypothetical protein [Streptomyces actinomycinicus]